MKQLGGICMNQERIEKVLQVIDKLGIVTVKQLHEIMQLGTYRNTCRIVNQLSDFLHVDRGQRKIIYLNKDGREFIGSDKEIKKSILFDHMLLTNQAYIYFNFPFDWKREYVIESKNEPEYQFGIQIKGITVTSKKKIISDAGFTRNGNLHLVEIDNTRSMKDNKMKIEKYTDMWNDIKKHSQPILYFFTTTNMRKQKLETWVQSKKIRCEVHTFDEIK
jgi:hypothetical protein